MPPYSPDLNPIEKAWAKLKQLLRAAKARTKEASIRPSHKSYPCSQQRMRRLVSTPI